MSAITTAEIGSEQTDPRDNDTIFNTQHHTTSEQPMQQPQSENELSAEDIQHANQDVEEEEEEIPSHTSTWSEEKRAEYADYIATQRIDYEPVMETGMQVIMDYGKGPTFVRLVENTEFRTKTGRAQCNQLLGYPFQTVFAVEGKNLRLRETGALSASDVFEHLANKDDPNFLPSATNAELFDDGQNQALTEADIRKMKEEGKSSEEIIRAVAEASKTFGSKTEFSQEKWFKRKAAKYNTDIHITRPTPQSVLQFMIEKDHRRIYYLREDSLAQMIQRANIGSGSRTIIFETVGGLVTATAAYRMGGFGTIIAPYIGLSEPSFLINRMNLTAAERKSILQVPLSQLMAFTPVNKCVDTGVSAEEIEAIAKANAEFIAKGEKLFGNLDGVEGASADQDDDDEGKEDKEEREETSESLMTAASSGDAGDSKPKKNVGPTRHAVLARKRWEQARSVLKEGATGLVICTNSSPLEVMLPLLNLLLPGSPFVVYAITPEPLARAQNFLVQRKIAVNVQIAEYWYRPLQVLPNRTHPVMTCSATGGYLLTGYTIAQP